MKWRRRIAIAVLGALGMALLLAVVVVPWGDNAPAVPAPRGITPGTAATVQQGKDLVIWLPSNPSTGYSWTAAPNPQLAYVTTRQIARTNRPGTPDTQQLTFHAVRLGSTTLKLAYARPFEHGVPPAKTMKMLVRVKK
ncbi:MAG: protease inhibitor I42 family protein [Acidimicrobiia bacterium]